MSLCFERILLGNFVLFGRMCVGCCVSYVFCVHFRGKIVIYCWVSHNILVANSYGHQLQELDHGMC
jgi:hypothetical protein